MGINTAADIPLSGLFAALLLAVLPLLICYRLKLNIIGTTAIAILRMTGQLFCIALLLNYFFIWNNALLNLGWLLVMIGFACHSVIESSELNLRRFALPVFGSFALTNLFVLFYTIRCVLQTDRIFDAKYLIVIGGMLLGNSLRGNIVALNLFYTDLKRHEDRYFYQIACGATVPEAVHPYMRTALLRALKPNIASMATVGLVFIPGMMTGQVLGGTHPVTSIKYQIMIMLGIFCVSGLSIALSLRLTMPCCFDAYGRLRPDTFVGKKH